MLLIAHIGFAIISLLQAGFIAIKPSKTKLVTMGALSLLTIVSGAFLVAKMRAPLASSCLTGIAYLGLIALSAKVAHIRLTQKVSSIEE